MKGKKRSWEKRGSERKQINLGLQRLRLPLTFLVVWQPLTDLLEGAVSGVLPWLPR